ncbi:MAG: ChbG/HpnK family deacetylase, partial [Chloroflexi bacterium]|nr:ChbG/HpnK family deacetylase [Chloroflexota bacterium]
MTRSASALVVVADDFGASPGTNAGIVHAHQQGIVTAAALMVGLPHSAPAAALARDVGLAVGLHLRLTAGPALTQDAVRAGLATTAGFRSLPVVLARLSWPDRHLLAALRAEVRAQMEALLELVDPPDHVNTHHHVHLHPALLGIVLEEAKAYGFPAVRWPVEPWWGPGSAKRTPEVWALRLLAMLGRGRL